MSKKRIKPTVSDIIQASDDPEVRNAIETLYQSVLRQQKRERKLEVESQAHAPRMSRKQRNFITNVRHMAAAFCGRNLGFTPPRKELFVDLSNFTIKAKNQRTGQEFLLGFNEAIENPNDIYVFEETKKVDDLGVSIRTTLPTEKEEI